MFPLVQIKFTQADMLVAIPELGRIDKTGFLVQKELSNNARGSPTDKTGITPTVPRGS